VRRLEHGDFDQNPAECALVGLAEKGCEQLGRGVGGAVGFADAMKPQKDCHAAFVQRDGKALSGEEHITLHQANGDRIADGLEDAKASRLRDGFLAAAFLLRGLFGDSVSASSGRLRYSDCMVFIMIDSPFRVVLRDDMGGPHVLTRRVAG
jgi:hypothetical protein